MNIYSYFEESFRKSPKSNALFVDNEHYSYEQLFVKSNEIASLLIQQQNCFIGLLSHRSVWAFSGVLGILKSGNAYVPLNPRFPAERIARIILESEIDTLIVEASYIDVFKQAEKFINRSLNIILPDAASHEHDKINLLKHNIIIKQESEQELEQEHLNKQSTYAYMLFTSGSTGKPKGVPISHTNVICYISNMNKSNDFNNSDRFSNTFDLTFDLSVHDMFVCWSNGGELYCIPENALMAPANFIKRNKLSCWFSVPTLAYSMEKFRMLKQENFPDLRYSFFCGEPMPISLAEKWQNAAPNSVIKNIYGPTEATIGITSYTFCSENSKSFNGILSIGKIFNKNTYLINESSGELLLSGCQVTDKYWKDIDRTNSAFEESAGKIWYKTGDIVREDDDGDLFFIGRKDNQVKIRGYRVEPGEVDFVISSLLKNANVVTFAHEVHNTKTLIACINHQTLNTEEHIRKIMNYCKKILPDYMVPSVILFFQDFPVNSSGKVDRVKLIERAIKMIDNRQH